MPDLNWKNPEVRHAMLEIAEFWLEKGIDGLRLMLLFILQKPILDRTSQLKIIATNL